MNVTLIPIFLVLGAVVGFMAGLLGIGGGFTMVPVLVEVFSSQGFAREHIVPMAIGTSAGTIVFTAFSSARAHHARGAVDWRVVAAMSPGIIAGSLVGPQIASALPPAIMAGVFGSFIWWGAWRMLRNRPPVALAPAAWARRPDRDGIADRRRRRHGRHRRRIPRCAVHDPLQRQAAHRGGDVRGDRHSRCDRRDDRLHVRRLEQAGLPAYAVGYVYMPALVGIVVTSTLLAPVGARVAHALPVAKLRFVFASMLFLLGAYMWWKALHL